MKTPGFGLALQRIVCPLDIEQPSLSPLRLASLIAERFGASIEALYVDSNATSAGFGGLLSNAGRVDELMTSHNAEQSLEALVRGLKGPVSVTTRLVLGTPIPAILERATEPDCDLIVLGARQRSDLGWQFRDDVARSVAALAGCATLTVHDRDMHDSIERILVPVGFEPVTAHALEWAAAFGVQFSAEVQLLHVVSRERSTVRSLDHAQKVVRSSTVPDELGAKLAELAQGLTRLGVAVKSETVIGSSVANGIADYNDRSEFDLVVVGMNGPPQSPPRLTRGIVPTLRNRMSVPILSVRVAPLDGADTADGTRSGQREATG